MRCNELSFHTEEPWELGCVMWQAFLTGVMLPVIMLMPSVHGLVNDRVKTTCVAVAVETELNSSIKTICFLCSFLSHTPFPRTNPSLTRAGHQQ